MSLVRHLVLHSIPLQPSTEWAASGRCWTFLLVEAGHSYWINGECPRELKAGDGLSLAPGVGGGLRASQLGFARLRYFTFCPELLTGFFTLSERDQLEKLAMDRQLMIRLAPLGTTAARQFQMLAASADTSPGLLQRCSMLRLVTEVFGAQLGQPVDGLVVPAAYNRFEHVVAQLTEQELLSLKPDELAEHCNCSERHLKKLFRRKFGVSLKKKQIQLRLQKASELLRETDTQIGIVARDCDYKYPRAFEFAFKKEFGLSPAKWRLQNRADDFQASEKDVSDRSAPEPENCQGRETITES